MPSKCHLSLVREDPKRLQGFKVHIFVALEDNSKKLVSEGCVAAVFKSTDGCRWLLSYTCCCGTVALLIKSSLLK